ncbi:MAG: GNAT family N-acetyltransferase [Caldimonas sp.]
MAELHGTVSSRARSPTGFATVRRLTSADLPAYKQLRDEMLVAHPEAFTSDAETEASREPTEYLQRLGLDRVDGGHFLLGALRGERLIGAIGCEREARRKVCHLGHVIGMMVRAEARRQGVAHGLLAACTDAARRAGLETLTLSVTAGNHGAIGLYEQNGFVAYGRLARALKVGPVYYDKLQMALRL